jgi:hypothetical protein
MANPTVEDIRRLGFEWPKYPLVEQYCVESEGQIDLAQTIGKLLDKLLRAPAEFSQAPESRAEAAGQCNQAIDYLREIQVAVEKQWRPQSLWRQLGVKRAERIRDLTKTEVDALLGSRRVRCAGTDDFHPCLGWLSQVEVERIQPSVVDPGTLSPSGYVYWASEWQTDENETILVFSSVYLPI